MRLGEIALKWGLLSDGDLERCLGYQRQLKKANAHMRLGQVMVHLDYISTTQLVALLETQKKIRQVEDEEGTGAEDEGADGPDLSATPE